ncbi:PepSY domain-containing protein [Aquibacillus koreensis]|uniref:PepSY domain-containing protein n=1 Tax=Aquibacillus koreensis TaxID=279446 RepID=A0A9X3WLI7_9BACI|nr:PepSY domain-containing protein [Aquibacillus koreensis]MCT2535457.1 PepSY domain-containing protein [Aquibacillus koreensis]MDC3422292.1 PepSY domain-containing protein [Aquibacillus koreensis]
MKKKIMIVTGVIVAGGLIGFALSQTGVVSADPSYSKDDIRKEVLELYPGEITELELEKQGKKVIYEIEIDVDGKEYELEMDGNTGEVLKLDEKLLAAKDASRGADVQNDDRGTDDDGEADDTTKEDDLIDDESKKESDDGSNADGDDSKNTLISQKEAEKIALENFAGTIEELELDEDDNRLIYEIEIVNGKRQADIDIDAYTGKVLVLDIETDED